MTRSPDNRLQAAIKTLCDKSEERVFAAINPQMAAWRRPVVGQPEY